jgi:hypothetical protein
MTEWQGFVNVRTHGVLQVSAERDGCLWAAGNPATLGTPPLKRRYRRYDMDDAKLMRRSLSAAGWSFFLGIDHPVWAVTSPPRRCRLIGLATRSAWPWPTRCWRA